VVISSNRRVENQISYPTQLGGPVARMEIDNHADTHVTGSNCTVLYYTGRVCNVAPFTQHYKALENVKIATVATAYDDTSTGETVILIFNEALHIDYPYDMCDSLINPNQCRAYGISICDDPFDPNRPLGLHDPKTGIFIPFEMQGTTAGFKTRAPQRDEVDRYRHIIMCDDAPWDPTKIIFPKGVPHNNSNQNDYAISMIKVPMERHVRMIDDPVIPHIDMDSCSHVFANHCIATINVTLTAVNSSQRHSSTTAEEISRKWKIGLQTAQQTLKCTTQNYARHALRPLTKRYKTRIPNLHHQRLRTRIYTDTLFSRIASLHGNKCAQVFCNEDYIKVIPMKLKSHAGRALVEFIQDVGAPTEMIADGAAELSKENTEFMENVRQYHILLRHTEPHTPRQNFAERMIGELKRKWKHRMVTRSIPKRLWDYGLVYEAEIMSRTARGSQGCTGVERLTGDSVDISEWIDFEFYDIVWYWHDLREFHYF
jgi:hypothetical protein